MFIDTLLKISEYILFLSCISILLGSIFISFKTRFIQLRFFPALFQMLKTSLADRKTTEGKYTILPHRALFTAMNTTIGIGTIVGPVIAMQWGGPGAILGFVLTAFFGSAATYTEVSLCIKFRKEMGNGEIWGGPMQYLKHFLSPFAAKWYAVCGAILMCAWSAAQANQLSAIFNSPLLGDYRVPTAVSGCLLSVLVLIILIGGIKRVSAVAGKLVPTMFLLYIGSCTWIISSNLEAFWEACCLIVQSAFSPYAMASGSIVGGIVSSMRWGIFKGTQATEAGVGTQTIPHSMARTNDPVAQGMLAMFSTYTAGIIGFISGCVSIITKTWEDPSLPMGISMVAASFQMYFSYAGIVIVAISTLLFAFGTIIGNSYNGSQCFGYLTQNKRLYCYYALTALTIFLGTISGVQMVWSIIDIGLACLVLPHMAALIIYVIKQPEEALPESTKEALGDGIAV